MWKIKKFRSYEKANNWIKRNEHRVQYTQVFVHGIVAIEYRPLRVVG